MVKVGYDGAGSEGGTVSQRVREQTCQIDLAFAVGAPEVGAWPRHEPAIGNNGLTIEGSVGVPDNWRHWGVRCQLSNGL